MCSDTEVPNIMSWSRLYSRIAFLNHSKNLQFLSSESRFLPSALYPSYKFFKAPSGCSNSAWSLVPGCEFSTRPLTKRFDINPHRSRCLGRLSPFSIQRYYASHVSTEQKSEKTLVYLTTLVFAMMGSSYAAVPLYRRFCQATGFGGTVQRREIVVQFNADVGDGMPWKFSPTQSEVRVKPGESALAFCTAENQSSTAITGVSTYNVTPMKFTSIKNSAFALRSSALLPGEQIDMPVFFYLDPRMDGINSLILSYTSFKVSEE